MTYSETHPWLTFALNLNELPSQGWLILGQCVSGCEYISGVPLRPATAKHLHEVYLAKGVCATTAIEGNTLSEDEVLARIEGKGDLPPSRKYLGQEVDNIISECNRILKKVQDGKLESITSEQICDINRIVLDGLELNEDVVPGCFRSHSVGVGKYRAPQPQEVPALTRKLCEFLDSLESAERSNIPEMAVGILKSVIAHLYIAWIHPFGDGNGRTARLVEHELLLQCGVPSASAHLLSNHYNQTRAEYYRQLDKVSQSRTPIQFILYALQGFLDGLEQQASRIRAEHLDVAWRNYVHESFRAHKTPVWNRRRHLVLDLSGKTEGAMIEEIPLLTPRLADWYKKRTSKTLTRDLNAVRNMGLVTKDGRLYKARRELIRAFLPLRKRPRLGTPGHSDDNVNKAGD